MRLEDLQQFTYSVEEVNEWFRDTDCTLEIKRSSDGTHLEVWDSSGWLDWEGEDEDFKPFLSSRLYLNEDYKEETWCRHLVYSGGCMMALFGGVIGDCFAGNPRNPDSLLPEFWYVLCAFTRPEAAWELVHGKQEEDGA